jgi:hypothetical protein
MIDERTKDLPYSIGHTININDISRSSKRRSDEEEVEQEEAVLNVPMCHTSPVCLSLNISFYSYIHCLNFETMKKKSKPSFSRSPSLLLLFNPYNLLIRYMIDYSHACSKLYINKHSNQPFLWTESINFLYAYMKTKVQMSCHSKLSFVYFNLTNASHSFRPYATKK